MVSRPLVDPRYVPYRQASHHQGLYMFQVARLHALVGDLQGLNHCTKIQQVLQYSLYSDATYTE
jgi:hypothetical protein